ncbi:cellulose biosynthesis protein BcsF [Stenotrophomonas acidaminiphila]|uniref:cellulose biosynthesis protein BcsF n=1 Tax=Stenotrophomonas acidaminiphila TaxID=128780 RepID=UPI0015F79884|nr:cellulose biosynthesis protein BcsF [Stenotrophomonas acidaminiphila]
MNDQQVWSLVAACALVMIPLGVMLGWIVRALRARLRRGLPPRYLKRVGERRRQAVPRRPA